MPRPNKPLRVIVKCKHGHSHKSHEQAQECDRRYAWREAQRAAKAGQGG